MAVGYGIAAPKPEKTRKQTKAREKRKHHDHVAKTRAYVFGRERDLCRTCRKRTAASMHELRFRSLGGKVSRHNSVAVCGDGVNGCHGLLQRNEIDYIADPIYGAEGRLEFIAVTQKAADWLGLKRGEILISEPMILIESAE